MDLGLASEVKLESLSAQNSFREPGERVCGLKFDVLINRNVCFSF
jgi:hypothetical protein